MQSHDLLSIFISPLEKCSISYFVTGSIASIFYGEPRLTHDIDIVIHLSENSISHFISFFPLELYYCPPEEVIQIESKRKPFGHFNLIHHESGLKADIYPDVDDKLHSWALQNRKRIDLDDHLSIWLAPPEYVIIRKLEYYREGGSDKHINDIQKMMPQVNNDLKINFLNEEISKRGLLPFWKRVVSTGF